MTFLILSASISRHAYPESKSQFKQSGPAPTMVTPTTPQQQNTKKYYYKKTIFIKSISIMEFEIFIAVPKSFVLTKKKEKDMGIPGIHLSLCHKTSR